MDQRNLWEIVSIASFLSIKLKFEMKKNAMKLKILFEMKQKYPMLKTREGHLWPLCQSPI